MKALFRVATAFIITRIVIPGIAIVIGAAIIFAGNH